jgi:hypothetical protein
VTAWDFLDAHWTTLGVLFEFLVFLAIVAIAIHH